MRHLRGHREGDRAAAGAEVDRDRRGGGSRPQRVDRELRHDLGLRARDEHPGPHAQLQVAEGGGAGDVLQGLARRAARERRLEPTELRGGEHVAAQRRGLHAAASSAQHVRGEQLRVDGRIRDARAPELVGGAPQHGGQRRVVAGLRGPRRALVGGQTFFGHGGIHPIRPPSAGTREGGGHPNVIFGLTTPCAP